MSFFMFSPDGKDFCQFMTPNFPKPMFLAHFHPGLVGMFFFYPNMVPGPRPVALALGQAQPEPEMGSTRTRHGAQPGPGWEYE